MTAADTGCPAVHVSLPSSDPVMSAESWADLSDCGTYRYRLGRRWAEGPVDVWIMLNPSTADATVDDRTIGRCMEFSRRWGAGALVVGNLFALRATDPTELVRHPDPIGPDNDEHLTALAAWAHLLGGRVIAGWGAHPMAAERARIVHRRIRQQTDLLTLGTTKAGAPRHPLYVKGDTPLTRWAPR
jgi:hypothetical protein